MPFRMIDTEYEQARILEDARLPCGCIPGQYLCPTAVALWSALTHAWDALWGKAPTGTWQEYDRARDTYRAHYPSNILG